MTIINPQTTRARAPNSNISVPPVFQPRLLVWISLMTMHPSQILDWSPSLAAFFDSVETPALESSSNPSFLPPNNLSFALPRYTLLPIYQPFSHHVERYELDPHTWDAVNNTQIIQRLNQGSVIQDKVIW
jgi:hypothetical protein